MSRKNQAPSLFDAPAPETKKEKGVSWQELPEIATVAAPVIKQVKKEEINVSVLGINYDWEYFGDYIKNRRGNRI